MALMLVLLQSCQRNADNADDDIPQEELTDVILNIKNLNDQSTVSYDYNVGTQNLPNIKLEDGVSYDVEVVFKNGNENVTQEIIEAKDEHFLLFNFPKSKINLTRIDDEASTRSDGKKLGIKTHWQVVKAVNSDAPVLILTLIHDAVSVSEALDDTTWGKVVGGETDAEARYEISN